MLFVSTLDSHRTANHPRRAPQKRRNGRTEKVDKDKCRTSECGKGSGDCGNSSSSDSSTGSESSTDTDSSSDSEDDGGGAADDDKKGETDHMSEGNASHLGDLEDDFVIEDRK